MEKYEIAINVFDEKYVDNLIVALVRQGYNVYYNPDTGDKGVVCFTATDEEVNKIEGS